SFRSAHRDLPRPLALGPGSYVIEVSGRSVEQQWVRCEITSGRETHAAVAVTLGTEVELRFTVPKADANLLIHYAVQPADGAPPRTRVGQAFVRRGETSVASVTVVTPGAYRVQAQTPTGLLGTKDLRVPPGDTRSILE